MTFITLPHAVGWTPEKSLNSQIYYNFSAKFSFQFCSEYVNISSMWLERAKWIIHVL